MDDELDFEYLFKVILVGDSGVGKSNLGSRFTRNEFIPGSKATIGVDFAGKTLMVQGSKVRAQIWDTAGQERFKAVSNTYYRNAAAAMVVYDITSRKSFTSLTSWLRDLRDLADQDVLLMVVGNKSDLEESRAVTTEEGRIFAEKEKVMFMETSAKSGANVTQAFQDLLSSIIDSKRNAGELRSVDQGVGHHQPDEKIASDHDETRDIKKGIKLQVPNETRERRNCCS